MTETTVIDTNVLIALLDVDNVLDNEYWKWCADEVMDENDEFLPDEVLTYTNFEITPDEVLPAGTTVVMPYLWGFNNDVTNGGMTAPTDYEVTLDAPATASRVVHVVLSQYWTDAEAQGAVGRFYFIEGMAVKEDGRVEIVWGS